MPAKKTASSTPTSTSGRSRVTSALRKATGVVAKAAGRGPTSSPGETAADSRATASTTKPAVKKTVAKKPAPAKRAATKAAPAKKAAAVNATPKKAVATKAAPVKKTMAKKATPAKKAVATKAVATKAAPARAASSASAPTTPAAAKKTPVKKTPAKKTAVAQKAAAKKTASIKKSAVSQAAAATRTAHKTTTPTQKVVTKKVTSTNQTAPASAGKLKVRDDESPWTAKELEVVRAELQVDVERLSRELSGFESDIAGLIKDSGDGAGDDQADTGAKTFEREHEASLAQNSRDLLEQSVHALQRIDDGTYGVCENCGNAIGKLRLQAFPRATLCLSCKAKQERR